MTSKWKTMDGTKWYRNIPNIRNIRLQAHIVNEVRQHPYTQQHWNKRETCRNSENDSYVWFKYNRIKIFELISKWFYVRRRFLFPSNLCSLRSFVYNFQVHTFFFSFIYSFLVFWTLRFEHRCWIGEKARCGLFFLFSFFIFGCCLVTRTKVSATIHPQMLHFLVFPTLLPKDISN